MTYTIESYEWQWLYDNTWEYVDYDLAMVARIEVNQYDASPESDGLTNPCVLAVQSATVADENNYYFYDGFSSRPYNGPCLTRRESADYFPGGLYNGPSDVSLPDWLIKEMRYLSECDDVARCMAWRWAQDNKDTTWDTPKDREDSASEWFERNYPDGNDRIPYGGETIAYYAYLDGMFREDSDGCYVEA